MTMTMTMATEAEANDSPGGNRILFLTNSERGQANVFLAVIQEIIHLDIDSSLDLHVCSFAPLSNIISKLQLPVSFHELRGTTWQEALFTRPEHRWEELTSQPPTLWNANESATIMPHIACPWSHDEMSDMVSQLQAVVADVKPDLVVIDNLLTPAVTICYPNPKPRWIVLSPNTYKEFILFMQPNRQAFWKYPPPRSAIPFPVPWYQTPSVWYQMKCYLANAFSPYVINHALHLIEKNKIEYSDWGRLFFPPEGLRVILPSRPEIDFPFDYIPDHLVPCGPIVMRNPKLSDSHPELAGWLAKRETIYVNLGTHASYDDVSAIELAGALRSLLKKAKEQARDLQVLWKLKSRGGEGSGREHVLNALGSEFSDAVRIVDWLEPEPISILETGNVICSVHHGGANSYFEAVSAGIPQVVLPVWYDTYDFAKRVEWLGIGRFGNYYNAPLCNSKELGPILVDVVLGKAAEGIKTKARDLAETCRTDGGGRFKAATEVLSVLKAVKPDPVVV